MQASACQRRPRLQTDRLVDCQRRRVGRRWQSTRRSVCSRGRRWQAVGLHTFPLQSEKPDSFVYAKEKLGQL